MPEDIKPSKPEKVDAPAAAENPDAKPAAADGATAPKKKSSTLKVVLIIVGVLAGLAILGSILLFVVFKSAFDKAFDDVDVNDGNVTIQSDDGTTSVGENAKLAEGFPDDVPIYEPSTLMASSKVEETSFSAVAKTSKSVSDVAGYYRTEMAKQGWTTQLDSAAEDGTLLTFQKDDRTSSVIVTTSEDESSDEKTGFVVSVSTQQ